MQAHPCLSKQIPMVTVDLEFARERSACWVSWAQLSGHVFNSAEVERAVT